MGGGGMAATSQTTRSNRIPPQASGQPTWQSCQTTTSGMSHVGTVKPRCLATTASTVACMAVTLPPARAARAHAGGRPPVMSLTSRGHTTLSRQQSPPAAMGFCPQHFDQQKGPCPSWVYLGQCDGAGAAGHGAAPEGTGAGDVGGVGQALGPGYRCLASQVAGLSTAATIQTERVALCVGMVWGHGAGGGGGEICLRGRGAMGTIPEQPHGGRGGL